MGMKCIALTVSLLVAGGFFLPTANSQCQITIIGNETFINGLRQDVTCVFNCQNVASIRWYFVVGPVVLPYGEPGNSSELVASVNPAPSINGSQLRCVVVDTGGRRYVETFTIIVTELEHTLNITASQGNAVVAGTRLTLTCIAVTTRPAHLKWLNSDGDPVNSTSSITVSQPVVNGATTTLTVTFDPLKTSHSCLYTCSCMIKRPRSDASASYSVLVKIPAPTVIILRDPPALIRVSTGDSITMTCITSISEYVDTPATVEMAWTDRLSLRDSPRVAVSRVLSGSPHQSSVSISSVRSGDTGTYECCVRANPSGTPCVNDSNLVCRSIDISASLTVEIHVDYEVPCDYEYASPPYYRPCSPITLRCEANGASGRVAYRWTSTNAASFVSGGTNQTESTAMLTYLDGGSHKCCAHDNAGNSGCDKIEIFIKGQGLYIDDSEYVSEVGAPNNSIVVPRSSACTNCKLDVYCCSDRRGATMRIVFPDGVGKTMASDYYNMDVEQLTSTARVRAFNHLSLYPQLYGLYCCSMGSPALSSSVAVYSSLPGPPRVYSSGFVISEDPDSDYIMSVKCSTSDSPPTKVEWCRNGEPIEIDGTHYMAEQQVTSRRNMYFDNILYVKNSCFAAGRHEFECKINNSRGGHSYTVETNVPVYSVTEITSEGSQFAGDRYVLTCTATLPQKLKDLLRFLQMEWVGPPDVSMTMENMVKVGSVAYSECGLSRTLTFDPLKTGHSGLYRCTISISKTELAPFFEREIRHNIAVITQSLFQLQFGPVSDCSSWISDPNISYILENNIKEAVVAAINQRCSCDFHVGLIDLGEMSCQSSLGSSGKSAVFRAQLTATVYTAEQLLAMLQDWLTTDGTFLFTYNGRTRLRLNPNCLPLAIASFSAPECGLSVADINSRIFQPGKNVLD